MSLITMILIALGIKKRPSISKIVAPISRIIRELELYAAE